MAMQARLLAIPTDEPNTVHFRMSFPVPSVDSLSQCAQATLETGDGRQIDLGLICAPTVDTWPEQHSRLLAEHTFAGDGRYVASLTWGDDVASTVVTTGDGADPGEPDPDDPGRADTPDVIHFHLTEVTGAPLTVAVVLEVSAMLHGHWIRVDGGARNTGRLGFDQLKAEWQFTYQKPGPYRLFIDLIDEDGYRLARVGTYPFNVSSPIDEPVTVDRPRPPDSGVLSPCAESPTDSGDIMDALPPWIPFRYALPLWSSARTYTQPGGSVVSRYLSQGTYLGLHEAVEVGNETWYQTASYDWIAASSVSDIVPSTLKGIELRDEAPPLPPPQPPPRRGQTAISPSTGVVTANVLNVHSGPGAQYPVVGRRYCHCRLRIHSIRVHGDELWYRIDPDRWVHSASVSLEDESEADTLASAPKRGVVTAFGLNVRSVPGVRNDNPPTETLARNTTVDLLEEAACSGSRWFRIGDDRWVQGAWVHILGTSSPVPAAKVVDREIMGAEIRQLPVGWVTAATLNVRRRPGVDANNPPVDAVSHNQPLPILETFYLGEYPWYRIGDDRWVYGGSVGMAKLRLRPSSIRSDELWVGVNLYEQTLVAYEGDRPVYAALVATGLPNTPTVEGIFRTWRRYEWRKMSGGSAATGGYYYLEAVPWTCYFYSGYALHGAYWHDGFGRPRSHGCVNLSMYDSWWLFRWSEMGGPTSPAVYVYRY